MSKIILRDKFGDSGLGRHYEKVTKMATCKLKKLIFQRLLINEIPNHVSISNQTYTVENTKPPDQKSWERKLGNLERPPPAPSFSFSFFL